MRIDAHQHFTETHTPERLWTVLQRNRFDGSIAVVDAPLRMPPESRRGVLGQVIRAGPDLLASLDEHEREPDFRGVLLTLDGRMPAGLGELERRGIAVDVEAGPAEFPEISRIAGLFPGLRIAIGHLGRPRTGESFDAEWARGIEAVAQAPQVCCKLTGGESAARLRPYVQHALAVFGPGRLMFGSGWPSTGPWKERLAAFTQALGPLPMEIRAELFGGTAQRFYLANSFVQA